ncbi:hypothetical protein CRUP_035070 [Coryphaenoides rupestris]|nr:hypothetical protein CRUP_035070 [Coryphaenoides rupestris]
MSCKLNGLFSIGEDFDDEISSSVPEPSTSIVTQRSLDTSGVQDEFEDWDVDLADLDESDPQLGLPGVQNQHRLTPPTASSAAESSGGLISPADRLRPSNRAETTGAPYRAPGGVSRSILPSPRQPAAACGAAGPRPSLVPAPPRSPAVFPVPGPSPLRLPRGCHPPAPQRAWTTPGPRGRFEPGSPASPAAAYSPRPLSAPVLTNHLVQLVSAANKPPRKRPCSGAPQPSTRRFPGPAGLLPQQSLNQSLDDIVVSVPQTPAHGAVARLPSQCSGSPSEEDELSSSGPWGAMKADMGLDERNAGCFLHTYSVVMVLRKAALRQLAQNKVPNMAVQLKSILHTHADAKAVFRDPTGEIQGTVHRRLLEDRLGELKAGAVLLLKQARLPHGCHVTAVTAVSVFSPSHRNHYLNVTPSNLLRIYPPDGGCTTHHLLLHLHPLLLHTAPPSTDGSESHTHEPDCPTASLPALALRGPVSSMQLELEEEEGGGGGKPL